MGEYRAEVAEREAAAAAAKAEQEAELDHYLTTEKARQAELEALFPPTEPPKPAARDVDDGCEVTRDGWVVRRDAHGEIVETIGQRFEIRNGSFYRFDERTGDVLEVRRPDGTVAFYG